jgi:hypothetical protein
MAERTYIDIPGSQTHELPPLLVHLPRGIPAEGMIEMAEHLVDSDDLMPSLDVSEVERRKYDLAIQLVEQYKALVAHWEWGDSIVEWIRQCEITFGTHAALRNLLHPDVWPHAGRSSFVDLLREKSVPAQGVALDRAVGLRLTFRQPPPLECFSDQFLLYLNGSMAGAAYQTWARMNPDQAALLPPERFHFEVLNTSLH